MHLLKECLDILIETGTLPDKYRPHILSGDHDGEWEAHIKGDWLITWEKRDNELRLIMLATGTHSDLFG
ncbi:MAG: type II toxin-antitoxin system YafQ family toxin [Prevotella sp.]|nr:type II toxin-antitoxin system YafQ family toxin [Prevotella sp.]